MAGAQYEIVVRGRLGGTVVRSFRELEVRASGPDGTYLRGWLVDQAALQAILDRLGDLGVELSSIRQIPDAD